LARPGGIRVHLRPSLKGGSTARLEVELPRSREAPHVARRSLAGWLGPDLGDPEVDDAKLLASELVTNALVHGRGTIVLHAHDDENRLRVEVIDEGRGFEGAVRECDIDSIGGRGLTLVDTLATRWGIHEGRSHVWFELEHRGPRLGSVNNKPDTRAKPTPEPQLAARPVAFRGGGDEGP